MSESGHRTDRRADGYVLSTDPALLDFAVIHGYLARSYWSPGIARSVVETAARHPLCHGLYAPDGGQVGYARVVTDRATFAYLADVFVLDEHRGRGLGVALVRFVLETPDLVGIRRWMLVTRDAQSLYARFGFEPPAEPGRIMLRPGGPVPPACNGGMQPCHSPDARSPA